MTDSHDHASDHAHHHHDHDEKPEPRFAAEYPFVLLFDPPLATLDEEALRRLEEELGQRVTREDNGFSIGGGAFRFSFTEIAVDRDAIEQSWNWREARTVVPSCRTALRVSDHADVPGDAFQPEEWRGRVQRYRAILRALLIVLQPRAVFAPESQQYLEPQTFREALSDMPGDELFGFMNIRLFRIDGSEQGISAAYNETVMDTLGLSSLGLTDLQAHFKHLDPTLVAEFLYNTAGYIYEHGPMIESGHKLAGFAADHKWVCQLEASLIEPLRLVVDLDPGAPYSA
jgi:hypothetical protein